jgi:hypothetical protein
VVVAAIVAGQNELARRVRLAARSEPDVTPGRSAGDKAELRRRPRERHPGREGNRARI